MAVRRARMTPRRPLERDVQRQVMDLFALAGCTLYRTDQGFRKEPGGTRMTPGLADLLVFLPVISFTLRDGMVIPCDAKLRVTAATIPTLTVPQFGFFEVKTPDGLKLHHRNLAKRERRAVAQDRFGTLCRERGVPYAMGHMEQAWEFLASVGLARRERSADRAIAHVNHGYTLTPRRP